MIYTLTCNPAIDYVIHMNAPKLGATNRAEREEIFFGGKGINVSSVLAELGVETTAFGFIAGFTGDALAEDVASRGVTTDFIRLSEGRTRINVKLLSERETELNGQGPAVPQSALDALYDKLDRLTGGDTLVLAGNVPASLPQDLYGTILARLNGRGIRFVVDASGDALRTALSHKPFLVKPNKEELEGLLGRKLQTDGDIARAAEELHDAGVQNVLVSLGADGALLLDEHGELHRRTVPPCRPVNTVCAGDSMVAGFLAGLPRGYAYALSLAVAAGTATACAEGLATREEILAFHASFTE